MHVRYRWAIVYFSSKFESAGSFDVVFFLIGNSEHIKLVGHESNRWTGGSASLAYGSSGRADLFCNEGKYVIHGKRSNLFKCIEILFKD